MIDVFRSEWIKLRTVSVTWVLGVVALAFPIVVCALTATFDDDPQQFSTRDVAEVATGTSIVSAMLVGVIAAIAVTSEFGFGTIRPTFAAAPDRTRVLAAKAILSAAFAAAIMIVVLGGAFVVASLILDQRADPFDRPDEGGAIAPAFVGCVVLAVGLALLGYGLGLLIRNSPATTSTLLLWPLIVEGILGALVINAFGEGSQRWLPYFSGINMAVVEPEADGWGRVASGLYFAAWVAAIAAIGIITTKRRDA